MEQSRRGGAPRFRENVVVGGGEEGIIAPPEPKEPEPVVQRQAATDGTIASIQWPLPAGQTASQQQQQPQQQPYQHHEKKSSQQTQTSGSTSKPSTRHRATNSKSTATESVPTAPSRSTTRNNHTSATSSNTKSNKDNRQSMSAHMTFWRGDESPPPTPPSLPTTSGRTDKPIFAQEGQDYYDYRYDRVAPPAPIPQATVLGLQKRTFWMILAAVAVIVVLAVGIGAGVGVGVAHKKSSKTKVEYPSNATATLTTTATAPIPTASTTQIVTTEPCPLSNNTKYAVPDSNKVFLQLCDIDFNGPDGEATDIASVWTETMEGCMIYCAGLNGCTGCGWGIIQGDPGSLHRCWLKTNLTKTDSYKEGWHFGILLDSS